MLDLKQIRENPQSIQERLDRRCVGQYDLKPILELNQRQRELEASRTSFQARSNEIGKLIGQTIKGGTPADAPELQALRDEGNQVKATLSELEPQEKDLKAQIEDRKSVV